MDALSDTVMLSRLQFAAMAMVHISFSAFTVGLALFIAVLEALWLRTRDGAWRDQARFWSRLFLLNFGVGVVTGLPLEFAFGNNWAPFSAKSAFFGEILGTETLSAFMLEAAFLGVMVFGWDRVPPRAHFAATCMVAIGSSLSVFWIMVANSWMQTPAGVAWQEGNLVVTSYREAIFNPDMPYGVSHMYAACLEASFLLVGAVSAWFLRKGRQIDFWTRSFKAAVAGAVLFAPLQVLIGDLAAKNLQHTQPVKLAAMEAHWDTNRPGEGADWIVLALFDEDREQNVWAVKVPHALSLMLTYSPTGSVRGLKEFPREERPPVLTTFYTFRAMVVAGFAFVGLLLWSAWVWKRGGLAPGAVAGRKWLLRAWMVAGPAAWIAVESGWVTREVGRQPWLVYGLVRTQDAASPLPAGAVLASLTGYLAIAALLTGVFLVLAGRVLADGPAPTKAAEREGA